MTKKNIINIKEILKENKILEKDLKDIEDLKANAIKKKKEYDNLQQNIWFTEIDKKVLKVLDGQNEIIESLAELISKMEDTQARMATNLAKTINITQKSLLGGAVLTERIDRIEEKLSKGGIKNE